MIRFHHILILACLALFVVPASAQKQQAAKPKKETTTAPVVQDDKLLWLDWNEGYAKAVKTGKIVLVDAYTDWCGWCKKMDRDTYTNTDIIKKINQHFVPVKFNPELKDKIYKIGEDTLTPPQLYGMLTQGKSTGFPTTYYIYPAKMKVFIDPGYKGPDDFNKILDLAVEEGKK